MQHKKKKIQEFKTMVESNKCYSFNIPGICEKIDVKYNTMRKWFKEIEVITLNEYCQKWKLEYTKELLKYSNEKISIITHKIGFRNERDFISWFKDKAFTTPIKFIRRNVKIQN